MQSDRTLTLMAHAKVNLALSVGAPPGGAGLHPICSYMHAIGLSDTIRITRLDAPGPSRFEISPAGGDGSGVAWALRDDLVYRAHALLEARLGRALPVSIRVVKSIPAGGGLGGGSSDAAAALQGLDALFGLGLGRGALAEIGAELGSDIPFFIDSQGRPPGPAIVEGFGEAITRLERHRHAGKRVTLILPGFGCDTRAVYRALDAIGGSPAPEPWRVRSIAGSDPLDAGALFNDLALAAQAVAPELGVIRSRLQSALPSPVHVSGSGSTLFVLGETFADRIGELCPDCQIIETALC